MRQREQGYSHKPGHSSRSRHSLSLVIGLSAVVAATGAALAGEPSPLQSPFGDVAERGSAAADPTASNRLGGAWSTGSIDTPGTIPQLDVDGTDQNEPLIPYVGYYDALNNGGDLKFASQDETGAWMTETVLSTANDEGNAVSVVTSESRAHVFHHDQTTGMWMRSYRFLFSNAWSHEVVEDLGAPGIFGRDSGAAANFLGHLVVAYPDVGSTGLRIAQGDDEGSSSSWAYETLNAGIEIRDVDVVASGTSGDHHLAYVDVTNFDLHYALKEAFGPATTQIAQTDVGCGGCTIALAVDSADRPHIVYPSFDGVASAVVHTWLDGGTWMREDIDTGTVFNDFAYFSLEIDDFDNLHLSFQDGTEGLLQYAVKRDGVWSVEPVAAMPGGSGVQYVGMTINGSCPDIVWSDPVSGEMSHADRVGGNTHLVPADFASIQEAMSFACDGDLVEVDPGSYTQEGFEFYGKDLVVVSPSGSEATFVDLDSGVLDASSLLQGGASQPTVVGRLEGFTFSNNKFGRITNADFEIVDCHFMAGDPGNLFETSGLEFTSSDVLIVDSAFTGNLSKGQHGVLRVNGGSTVDIRMTTISGNRGQQGSLSTGGIYLPGDGGTVNLERSIVWGNCTDSGRPGEIHALGGTVNIQDCIVDASEVGGNGTINYIGDNTFTDPFFCDPEDCASAPTTAGDYTVSGISPALPANNPSGELIGAFPQGCIFEVRFDVDAFDAPAGETEPGFVRMTDPTMLGDAAGGTFTPTGTFSGIAVSVTGGNQWRDRGVPPGSQTYPQLARDFIGLDQDGAEMVVTISDLPAGEFQVTTYHLDWFVWANDNLFDIRVTDDLGVDRLVTSNADFIAEADHLGESFSVFSNGADDVVIRMSEDSGSDRVRFNGIGIREAQLSYADLSGSALQEAGPSWTCAWADYDQDGDLDLYIGNGGLANQLFRNDGGVFTDVTTAPLDNAGNSVSVAWADYDNDEDPDLYISNLGSPDQLLRNDGGTFVDVSSGPIGSSAASTGIAWADYDLDGDLDVYLVRSGQANVLLRNDEGTFVDAALAVLADAGPGRGAAWCDYDLDGDPDLYLANYGTANRLFINDGSGGFIDGTMAPIDDVNNGMSAAWGDYDGDGFIDLYVTNDGQPNKLFRNDGSTFTDVSIEPLDDSGAGVGATWSDADNDGDLDLYLVNFGTANRLFENQGDTFVDATQGDLGDAGDGFGAAWADYDGDGDTDLHLAGFGGNRLFTNFTGAGNHWLQVNLVGTVSNADGVGARVFLTPGGGGDVQYREVGTGTGYTSQNSLGLEFGLGTASSIDELAIVWPSGETQVLTPAVDQILTVIEPDATSGTDPVEGAVFTSIVLSKAIPNPFQSSVRLDYALPREGHVDLSVYDVNGRQVSQLVGGPQAAGAHAVNWDGRGALGQDAGAGVFFVRLQVEDEAGTSRRVQKVLRVN